MTTATATYEQDVRAGLEAATGQIWAITPVRVYDGEGRTHRVYSAWYCAAAGVRVLDLWDEGRWSVERGHRVDVVHDRFRAVESAEAAVDGDPAWGSDATPVPW